MKHCILGIDTSNYTTSVALVSPQGEVLAGCKRPLPVPDGSCGLRQSDALFAHTKSLPLLFADLGEYLTDATLLAVGVSDKPRDRAGSYMPCFLAGVSAAAAAAATARLPLFHFSHQCGHLMAAIHSARAETLLHRPFGAFHISGGTTELLRASYADGHFAGELVGGTLDISAGQLLDRVGVYMGLPFPCGAALERAAAQNRDPVPAVSISHRGCYVNLSGLENKAKQLYDQTGHVPLVAAFVLAVVERALLVMSEAFTAAYGVMPLLFAGGVMGNRLIRGELSRRYDAFFAEPDLSSDNAVGIALLAAQRYQTEAEGHL